MTVGGENMFYKLETQEKSNSAFDELDYNVICIQFEGFLKKRLKSLKSLNAYIKDADQYIKWFKTKNIKGSMLMDIRNIHEYKIYLGEVQKYKDSTVKRKMNTLFKLNEFLISFDTGNCNERILNEDMRLYSKTSRCKGQYNYITKSFIKL